MTRAAGAAETTVSELSNELEPSRWVFCQVGAEAERP